MKVFKYHWCILN